MNIFLIRRLFHFVEMLTITIAGFVVFGLSCFLFLLSLILMCACKREVIKDASSDEDLAKLFPEVKAEEEE